jgi:hypothetical protein
MAQNEEAVAVQKRKYLDLLDDEVMAHPSGANPAFKHHSHMQPLAHLLLPSATQLRANDRVLCCPTVPPTPLVHPVSPASHLAERKGRLPRPSGQDD